MRSMSAAISTREPRFDVTPVRSTRSRYRVKLRGCLAAKSVVVSVYLVVADSPEEAYHAALRYEPTATRRVMALDECDFVERVLGVPFGVESILARFSIPPPTS